MGARSCNCSGGICGPQERGGGEEPEGGGGAVSRREFIGLAGGAAATAGLISLAIRPALAKQAGVSAGNESAQALADWKRALHAPDAPRRYRSGVHGDVRFPLGGIGTGNIELGADGQFVAWQLFNTLRDGYVPFFWGVRTEKTARLLQTAGGPEGWTAVRSCEMMGEYPVADLAFADPELPVQVAYSAWTPFAPLADAFSSQPVACFVFRVSNPTGEKQTVSIGGFLQNPVGYDALGPAAFNNARLDNRHPNYGGNRNTTHSEKGVTTLSLQGTAPAAAELARPVRLYSNIGSGGFDRFPFERPERLTVLPLDALLSAPAAPAAGEDIVVCIDSAPLDLSENILRAVRSLVGQGATLIWSGVSAPLADAGALYAAGRAGGQTPPPLPDVVFEDFESGYARWKVGGMAFGDAPAAGTLPQQQAVSGFGGGHLVNSFAGGDDATGRLSSKPFVIRHGYIRFLVGGGDHPGTQVRLMIDGKTARAQGGRNEERLLPVAWDVRDVKGKTAHIEIVDEQKGPWGHINADHFLFSDAPVSLPVLTLLSDLLPAATGPEADRLPDARGGFRFTRRALEKGSVVRVAEELLPKDAAEIWGARQKAYDALLALASIPYSAPAGTPPRLPGAGTMALSTDARDKRVLAAFTDWGEAWRWFAGRAAAPPDADSARPSPPGETVNGALAASVEVPPGETRELRFVLAWHYPNHYTGSNEPIGNHYAARWPDARAVAQGAMREFTAQRRRTEEFRRTFYAGTLPYWLRDCVSSQISTLRHAGVVFRSAAGDLYGWEGANGCCPPTCTHVWGYEQTLAYLFPELERGMRRIDLFHQQNENGGVNNRTEVPVRERPTGEFPFADGHASTILKAYREVRNSPDENLLRAYWPRVRAAVDFLIAQDAAGSADKMPDGTLSGDQWNTYDNAIHGVNAFIGGYYLAALRAGEEMARRMRAGADADRFRAVFESGRKRLIEQCWNGEYFQQHLPGYESRAGEFGPGCLSDQLIGQWWAHQLDLGYLLPPDMVKTALASIFRHNWLPDHTNFRHGWRKFAGGTDKGLLLCTWPKGGRPAQTIPYVDEVWTGVEYQVAAHMLYEGMTDEAFAIIKGARDRYDGVPRAPMPRNPWSEVECGGHYVRAMSSWSLLTALSGFACDGPNGEVRFTPRHTPDAFQSFFAGPEGWGGVKQTRGDDGGKTQTSEIAVREGRLTLTRLRLSSPATAMAGVVVTLAGKAVRATAERHEGGDVWLRFGRKLTVSAGQTLRVRLT